MKTLFLSTFILMLIASVNGQSKKDIKESLVSYETVWKYDYEDGEETKYKEAEYSFDKAGNITMEKTFDEKGTVLTHMEYKYDELGNTITELTFNAKGKLTKREEFKYKGRLKIEKITFDADGKQKSKKVYDYKFFQ